MKQQIQIIATANVADKKSVDREYDRAMRDIAAIERTLAEKRSSLEILR